MARSYKTVELVIPELERVVSRLKETGEQVLPSERTLMAMSGSSRMTLRKALSELERRGIIAKGRRVRLIDEDGGKPVTNVSVAYVTSGWDYPVNPVWFRLGMALEKQMRGIGANYKAVCYGWKDISETWPGSLSEIPQIIIFADAPGDIIRRNIMSLRDKALIIAVDEDYIGRCDCAVALNNYSAGRMAARMIIDTGYRRPAMICGERAYVPFHRRRDGFLDTLAEAGLPTNGCVYTTPGENSLDSVKTSSDAVEEICRAGYDSLFLYTDEFSRMIAGQIGASRKIPDEFGLVTLDATGNCRNHDFQISAVSHGEEAAARKITEIVTAFAKGLPFDKITLVDPEARHGRTIKQKDR
jgi:hypothetical protein